MAVLIREHQVDVAANAGEVVVHYLISDLRQVIGLGEVGEDQVLQPRVKYLGDKTYSLVVGEMPVFTFHPDLQVPVVGTFHQHLKVMVAFQHQSVHFAKLQ